MGLRGFYPLLAKCGYTPDTIMSAADLRGMTIGIDGDFWLYKAMHGYTSGPPRAECLVQVVEQWCKAARACSIQLVLVFSGSEQVVEKTACLTRRCERRQTLEKRSQALVREVEYAKAHGNLETELHLREKVAKIQDAARHITKALSTAVVQQLQERGHQCIRAISEADFLLMQLSETGTCDAIGAEDGDILLGGAQVLIRDFVGLLQDHCSGRRYTREGILQALELTTSGTLLQLGCLLHCDYQPAIRGLGPVRALQYMRRYHTVERFLQSPLFATRTKKSNRPRFQLPCNMTIDEYIQCTSRTIDIFCTRPDTIDTHPVKPVP